MERTRDMFDTMTMTKVVGAFCGTLLVFLLGGWAAEAIYHVGGHGDEHEQAYVIETGGDDGAAEEDVVEVAFADVYAAADAGAGERIWRQCSACHRLEEGVNATGPYLHGVVGRQIAGVGDYAYSGTLTELGDEMAWTPENLSGFLEDPSGWAPGTKMTYNGLDDVEDRANLIAYLDTFGGS